MSLPATPPKRPATDARAREENARVQAASPFLALSSTQQTLAALVPVVVAIAVYLPALGNGFIWDDPTVLQQMRAMRSAGDLIVMPPIVPKFYYRPFIFVTYLIDRALGGETPFWFHASVIAWHVLDTWLVFVLIRRLAPAEWLIAAGAALLFAVYPTHVESVAWMAGRSDVIVCTFVLLTLLLFMQRERAWSAWLGGAAYLLGLLSKEMAIACLALVPAFDLLSVRRLYWTRYIPLGLATAIYFLLRDASLGAFVGGLPTGSTAGQLTLDLLRAVGFYVVRAVVPVGLCAFIPEIPDATLYVFAGLAAPLLAFALLGWSWRQGRWQVAFLVVWFFLTLAPSLTVIIRRSASAVVADRYLYVPSVASCGLLAWLVVATVRRWRLDPRWATTTLAVLAALFALQTVPYARVWNSNLTFWSDVEAKVPDNAVPHREVGTALVAAGRLDDAERAYQQALVAKSDPEGLMMTYSNLGNLYRRRGRFDDAEHTFDAALKLGVHPALYHNLGMTLMSKVERANLRGDQAAVQRDILKAREAFEQALKVGTQPPAGQIYLEWNAAKTHALLGQVLFNLGDRAGAREHLEAALRLEPTGVIADATREYLARLGK